MLRGKTNDEKAEVIGFFFSREGIKDVLKATFHNMMKYLTEQEKSDEDEVIGSEGNPLFLKTIHHQSCFHVIEKLYQFIPIKSNYEELLLILKPFMSEMGEEIKFWMDQLVEKILVRHLKRKVEVEEKDDELLESKDGEDRESEIKD